MGTTTSSRTSSSTTAALTLRVRPGGVEGYALVEGDRYYAWGSYTTGGDPVLVVGCVDRCWDRQLASLIWRAGDRVEVKLNDGAVCAESRRLARGPRLAHVEAIARAWRAMGGAP